MRLDHLLSREEKVRVLNTVESLIKGSKISGADALRGNTRSHPEHDGEDLSGRWYYAGDGMGEQVGARFQWAYSSAG